MIGSKLDLVAILCEARRNGEDPCVGDEDVQTVVIEFCRGVADAGEIVELAGEKRDVGRGGALRYYLCGGLFVAAGEVDVFGAVF